MGRRGLPTSLKRQRGFPLPALRAGRWVEERGELVTATTVALATGALATVTLTTVTLAAVAVMTVLFLFLFRELRKLLDQRAHVIHRRTEVLVGARAALVLAGVELQGDQDPLELEALVVP